ncbi:putative uncharacterised protein [Salmonella phage Vi01]|uniref:Uncharacterized protein n=1 Tax=Salmonella phage ViI TaxID=1987993 RepID=E1XTJ6_BPSAV|nr:putative uncharacterised protein [Salmonella phage Vi01]CBW38055.1 putative uncharacterised protein [Salmonella phage Vi01]
MAIEIIAQSKSGKTVMYGTEEGRCIINYGTITGESPEKGGRYLVEYGSRLLMVSKVDGREIMIPRKEYFDSRSAAMTFFLFQKRHELFVEAKDAGLDDATAELIAEGKMTLEAALGDMDCEAEAIILNIPHIRTNVKMIRKTTDSTLTSTAAKTITPLP